MKAYLDAVGEGGRGPLHDHVVASLRRAAEKPDGTLDPAKVEAWRARHRDALRALPETDKALLKEENLKVERLKYGIEIITGPRRRRRKAKKSAPASS